MSTPTKARAPFFRWLRLVGHYPRWLTLALLAGVVIILVELSVPRVFAFVIDGVLGSHQDRPVLPLLGTVDLVTAFVVVFGVLAALALVRSVLKLGRTLWLTKIGESIHVEIRGTLFDRVHRLPISYFDTAFTGKIMARITTDADALWGLLYNGIQGVLDPLLSLTLILIIIAFSAPVLSLLLLLVLPLFAWLFYRARKTVQVSIKEQRDTLASLYTKLQEQISGVRTVRIYGMAGRESQLFGQILQRLFGANVSMMRTFGLLGGLGDLTVGVGVALILCVGGWYASAGVITTGELVQFYAYAGMLFLPIQTIANTLAQTFSQAEVALGRIFELLDQEPAAEFRGGEPCPDLEGEVVVDRLSFGYAPDKPVLHEVSLTIPARSTVAIVGPSGSGKTSLVNLICRFYDYHQGSIKLDGLDLRSLEADSFRSQVSYVSQETFLFAGTVFENIQYAKPGATRDEVEQAARNANADAFIRGLPQGYDTLLGERGINLSGGQKQRLNIARALLRRPRILILDEPTSALDAESEAVILEALETSFRTMTCIVIAHRLSTVMASDCIFVLDQGRLVQQGRHAELLQVDGLYKTLCQKQFLDTDGHVLASSSPLD